MFHRHRDDEPAGKREAEASKVFEVESRQTTAGGPVHQGGYRLLAFVTSAQSAEANVERPALF